MSGAELSVELFRMMLDEQGLKMPDVYLRGAVEDHRQMRPALLEMRGLPLPFLDAWEPATCLAWIEGGGKCREEETLAPNG